MPTPPSGRSGFLAYDAYGNPLNFSPANALTRLLYTGEQFEPRTAMQYLRARYYDPSTGTFNRLDPFAGNMQDPQSLHKYLYVHGDPVQGIDPSGNVLATVNVSTAIRIGFAAALGSAVVFGTWYYFMEGGGLDFLDRAPAPKKGYFTIDVPVTVIRITASPSASTVPAPRMEWLKTAFSGASEFWKQYGIQVTPRYVEKENLAYLEMTNEQVRQAVDEFAAEYSTIVLIAISGFESPSEYGTAGMTPSSRGGAVVVQADSTTIAHELGHVFLGRRHTQIGNNIMRQGVSDEFTTATLLIERVYASKRQVEKARQYLLTRRS